MIKQYRIPHRRFFSYPWLKPYQMPMWLFSMVDREYGIYSNSDNIKRVMNIVMKRSWLFDGHRIGW